MPIEIRPIQEGGHRAVCRVFQGCHAEEQTVAEAIDKQHDVARVLLELRNEDGLPNPDESTEQGADRTLRREVEVAPGA